MIEPVRFYMAYYLFMRMNRIYSRSRYFFNKREIKILTHQVFLHLHFVMLVFLNWFDIEHKDISYFNEYVYCKNICIDFLNNPQFEWLVRDFKDLWFDCNEYIGRFSISMKRIYRKFFYMWFAYYNKYPLEIILKPMLLIISIKFFKWRWKKNFIKRKHIIDEKRRKKKEIWTFDRILDNIKDNENS